MSTKPRHRRPNDEYQDPESEFWIPNHTNNRDSADPNRARLESPEYHVNAHSVSQSDSLSNRPYVDPIEVTEYLVDKTAEDGFHLERVCRGCENWKPIDYRRPRRRGAMEPTESCFGCWFGHLDGGKRFFSDFDRDAADNWYSGVRAREYQFRAKLADAKSEKDKARCEKMLRWLEKEKKRALKACHKLGFDPRKKRRKPKKTNGHDIPASSPPPASLKELEKSRVERNCGNCSAWTPDEVLSTEDDTRGYCWARDGMQTSQKYWCGLHKLSNDR